MSPRTRFWLKRFLVVTAIAFAGIAVGRVLMGRPLAPTLVDAAFWAPLSGLVFVATRRWHAARGRRCELCGDEPE